VLRMQVAANGLNFPFIDGQREQQCLIVLARPILDVPESALRGRGDWIDACSFVDGIGGSHFKSRTQRHVVRLAILIADLISSHNFPGRSVQWKPAWTGHVSQKMEAGAGTMNRNFHLR